MKEELLKAVLPSIPELHVQTDAQNQPSLIPQ
jgi:hypothetical protein